MKNLIVYTGMALVLLTNIDFKSVEFMNGAGPAKESKKEIVANNRFKGLTPSVVRSNFTKEVINSVNTKKTFSLRNFSTLESYKTTAALEPIALFSAQKSIITADQLIVEDNAIIGNNISNETLALNYKLVNSTSEADEEVEPLNIPKQEKTADQLIAEDNAITGNNISNETQALNYTLINSTSEADEEVELLNIPKQEKTADQLIAEDNAITGNNISNETQALGFNVINKPSKS